jgi:hypothetical protein
LNLDSTTHPSSPGLPKRGEGGIRIGRVRNRDGREDIRAQSGSLHGRHCSRTSVLEADTAETDGDRAFGKEFIGLVIEFDFQGDVTDDS